MQSRPRLLVLPALLFPFVTLVSAQPTAEFSWRALNGPFGGVVPTILKASDGTMYAGSGGNEGGVYRSTDGGLTWSRSSAGIPLQDRSVDSIVEVDSGHVLAITNSHIGSFIYRSKDGGLTWIEQERIGGSAFARTPEGHILLANTGYGAMHRSTDNGYTWEQVGIPLGGTDDIAVNDSGHVFVAGWGFARSRDGGQTWQSILTGDNVRSVAIDAEGRVYAATWAEYASTSGVYRSEDNGNAWTVLKLGFRTNRNRNIAITAGGHILVGSWGQGVWRSTDDGATWAQSNTGLGHLVMRHLYVASDGTVFAGTEGGGLYRSEDEGESWAQVGIAAATATKLAFSPVSGDLFALVSGMARSADGGETWVPVNSGLANLDIRSFAIAQDGTLYAGGAGLVYRSDDNGDTWTSAAGGISASVVTAVGVAPDGTAYAANQDGIYESTDRGESWTLVDGMGGVTKLESNSAGDLFAGSWGQGIRRKLHGQQTWDTLNNGYPWISALFIARNDFVYANGRSEDNGDTWTGMGYYGTVAGFSDNSIGQLFVATTNFGDGIHRSTNFGATWEKVNAGIPTHDARAITVGPDDHLYAGAFHGSLYKTVLPTTISTAVEDDPETPGEFRLDQNFPNPFNPETTIGFSTPMAGRVRIAVYDLLGRHVGTALDRVVEAGRHHVPWDASAVPGGVYVYRLEAGGILVARTLVLLR